ncbi:glycosyltransferase family 2 protein [uncultured Bacteroides sp.]|uniref:glycosyltransferase family 2 protein n=1 Tax=uncultured Bacteroides sp. TaxID=162156 RepID=UPI0025E09A68|nr:glycosyltransferase family 2 protein [uncultured Bacteroides sp.]
MEQNNESKPWVTVITATYNLVKAKREKFIIQCLESVRDQSYPYIEHIVIDGASTDGTVSLLQKYVDLGWITLFSDPDRGIYDAMNKGILKAKGKYVNILNSDDFFHDKSGIEISVKYLEENEADYSYADACVLKSSSRKFLWKGDLEKLITGEHYCHQTMLVKTQLLRDMGGFDLSYCVSADSDMMIRLYAQQWRAVYVPYCFVTYRYGGYSSLHDEQVRIEHSTSLFRHIGCQMNLSKEDCFQLWELRFIIEQPYAEQLKLIDKVPKEFGSGYIKREFAIRNPIATKPSERRTYYLLGFIPIIEMLYEEGNYRFSLFGLLDILKISILNGKWKYYLFGFIPIWKVKCHSL